MKTYIEDMVRLLEVRMSPCWDCGRREPFDPKWLAPLLRFQTPKSVWDEYRENGYTHAEAMAEELSYL
jgi:hypothetical protein